MNNSPPGTLQEVESFKEKWVGLEAGHKGPVPESGVELESEEDEESGKREVWRSTEAGGSDWYHIARLD